MIAYGTVLVDDPARIGQPTTLGLDETCSAVMTPLAASVLVDLRGRRRDVEVPGQAAAPPLPAPRRRPSGTKPSHGSMQSWTATTPWLRPADVEGRPWQRRVTEPPLSMQSWRDPGSRRS